MNGALGAYTIPQGGVEILSFKDGCVTSMTGPQRLKPSNPPTPASAKAGAAPGTTAGVELLLLSFPRPFASPNKPSLEHSLGMLHPAANRHPKATHQWLLMGVQACRLPALKTLKTLKTFTTRNGGPSLPFARP